MKKQFSISIYLDTRRKKANGLFPVKLKVYSPATIERRYYPTKYEFTEKEFNSIWNSEKPRKETEDIRIELRAIENKAIETARTITPFNFEQFEKKLYLSKGETDDIITHYERVIELLKSRKQFGTAGNYNMSLKSIKEFIQSKGKQAGKIYFSEITPDFLEEYERYMTEPPKSRSITTVSMYIRALRTIFNNAISEKDIEAEIYPFGKRKYQIPAVRNVKKALNKEQLKKLFDSIPKTPLQQRAKDFWFFTYTCNGMNLKDIALLKYENLQGDKFVFYRAKSIKTAKNDLKPVIVYLNDFSKNVIEKYGNKDKTSGNFIFPIVSTKNDDFTNFRAIKNFISSINKNMKKIGKAEGIEGDITTYVARHSFATAAIRNGASMEFVGEAMNHSNLKTTQNYFAGFEEDDKRELMNNLMNF
jgi:integrase/recombinase XerD